MKVMKALGWAVVVAALTGCGAPPPEKVCDHLVKLAKTGTTKRAKQFAQRKPVCVMALRAVQKGKNGQKEFYPDYAKCVLETSTFMAAVEFCWERKITVKPGLYDLVSPK